MTYILSRTAPKTDFSTLCLLSSLLVTAPMSYFVFWCGHSRESNGYYYVTASWGPYDIIFTLSDGIIPLVLKSFSTPHKMIYNSNSIIIMVTTKKKKMYPGCLAHAVIGMFYSVVANQCQPQYAYFVQRCTGSVQTEANYNMYMGGGVR